jgi:hypothetical protein
VVGDNRGDFSKELLPEGVLTRDGRGRAKPSRLDGVDGVVIVVYS